jgi:hypothetical protein
MTYRQFWATVLIVTIVGATRHLIGDGAVAVYFVALGAMGVLLTVTFYRRRSRLARRLIEMSEDGRERTLVNLENNPLRAGLVVDLRLDAPRVPLRGAVEVFRYPAEASQTARWTMYGCAWLAGFIAVGALSDIVLNAQRFVGPGTGWWEIPSLVVGFTGGAIFTWWSARESLGVLAISDASITWSVPGRTPCCIPWTEVIEAKLGEFPQAITVKSRTHRITASDALVDCGRAINLVATRIPPLVLRAAV